MHLCKAAKKTGPCLLASQMCHDDKSTTKPKDAAKSHGPSFRAILLPRRATWHALRSLQYSRATPPQGTVDVACCSLLHCCSQPFGLSAFCCQNLQRAARLQVGTLAWLRDGSQEQPDDEKPQSKASPLHHRYRATGAVNKTC